MSEYPCRLGNWESAYAEGFHRNRFPWDFVVSFLSRCRNLINEEPVLLLEVGCGTGTNLAAGQEMGYEVFGIDSSETAIKLAGDRLVLDRQTNLRVGDFTALPCPGNGHKADRT